MIAQVFLEIRSGRDRDRLYSATRWRGHVFLASIQLPPFVAEKPAGHIPTIGRAFGKLGRTVNGMIGAFAGCRTTYMPSEAEEHAARS